MRSKGYDERACAVHAPVMAWPTPIGRQDLFGVCSLLHASRRDTHSLNVPRLDQALPREPGLLSVLQVDDVALLELQGKAGW